ncbi:MAG: T9SS type A sorting domain-containing protein [Bacteroidetes bacterium]|nr:T9SS type A sorting domain-containing protein [Bacteroidota bacterium]
MNGKVILQQNTLEGETKINTKILSSGLYLIHYTDGKTSENLKVMSLI